MKNCLIISDTHAPYHHPDTMAFLEAVKYAYDIQIVKHSGDVADNHTASYHEVEYGVYSARDEHIAAKAFIQELAEMFPKITVSLGNHCKMTYRKAKTAGIPEDHLKSYNKMYDVNWNWVDKDYFVIDKYNNCLLSHAMSVSTLVNAKTHSHCCIQGHHHGTFGIEYFADLKIIRWAMTVGCLVDPNSPAFNYAKGNTNNRPLIGVGGIIENRPILITMNLKPNGRWDGIA